MQSIQGGFGEGRGIRALHAGMHSHQRACSRLESAVLARAPGTYGARQLGRPGSEVDHRYQESMLLLQGRRGVSRRGPIDWAAQV